LGEGGVLRFAGGSVLSRWAWVIVSYLRRKWRAALCLLIGVGCGAAAVCVSDHVMHATSTPAFCASCHEIKHAYESWAVSSHASNAHGMVVECIDCHLPDSSRRFSFYYSKAYHGTKDVLVHIGMKVLGGRYDRERSRLAARADISNDRCLKCHQDLFPPGISRGALLGHRATLYPREGYEKSCLECHANLVHKTVSLFARRE